MSLFDKASLVITPNGVKEGKLYSIKPTDGSGDFDVVRATTATRVNSDGLIEVVPKNLLGYSEEFDNSYWIKAGITIESNSILSPNGSLTADKVLSPLAGGRIEKSISTINSSFSIYAKAGTSSILKILTLGSGANVDFNLDNGTYSIISGTGFTVEIVAIGNDDWYRCNINNISSVSQVRIYPSLTIDDSYLYLWGAQLEANSVATSYFPTTDRLNIPRLDYSNGSCPSILLEPQRTNLALRSEEFDDVYWGKTAGTTVTANTTISPNGTSTADTVAFASSADSINKFISTGVSVVNGTSYTFSLYTKTPTQIIYFGGATGGSGTNVFNGSIDVGNGWYRQSITRTWSASGTVNIQNIILLGASGSVFIWGAQLEAGSYATSYIPTVASAVTRNAETFNNAGDVNTFNDSEGVLFFDGSFIDNGTLAHVITISDGSNANVLFIGWTSSTSSFRVIVKSNSVTTCNLIITDIDVIDINKIALVYSNQNFKLYSNGFLITSSNGINGGNTPLTLSTLQFSENGLNKFYGNVKQIQYFPTALTDEQLIALTTL